jgi:TonB family protein
MKFCPVCQTRFDEEILRFCTKDGAPLVDENPTFTEMPSENDEAEDIGEETLIRRNHPKNIPAPLPDDDDYGVSTSVSSQRIVIPTSEEEKEPVIRAKPYVQPQYEQPRKSSTALVVLATMFGTFTVLAILAGAWYVLSNKNQSNANKNANVIVNTNPPNSGFNSNLNTENSLANFNANTSANENVNANANANLKTPSPTKTPSPKPSATPDELNDNTNANSNINLGNTNVMTRPSVTPTPVQSPTPRVSPSPTAPPSNVNVGIMNSRAVNLVKPAYPQSAKQMNASGQVTVQVSVDEDGNVTSARAVSGHPLLRSPAENAARQSRFNPVKIDDRAVKATGVLVYNFINQ